MTTEWDKVPTHGVCEDFLKDNPHAGAPCPIDPTTGQHKSYWVLPEEERAKGFVRPLRRSYIHVGLAGPQFPLIELTEEQRKHHAASGYTHFEPYPEGFRDSLAGRLWTQE